jgi:hypothetical protein
MVFVVAACVTAMAIAVPPILATIDNHRAAGAVRYLTTRIQRARMEAIGRSTNVALEFVDTGAGYAFAVYADGNGDGVRTQDIRTGIDPRLTATERLKDNFAGVDVAVLPNLPPVDPGGQAPGSDPIRLGNGNLLSYSATGTSSSGSIYVGGRGRIQYVIRVLGDTGRARILRYDERSGQWKPL